LEAKDEPRTYTQAQDVRDDLGNGGELHLAAAKRPKKSIAA
jgi:hypothetical protein